MRVEASFGAEKAGSHVQHVARGAAFPVAGQSPIFQLTGVVGLELLSGTNGSLFSELVFACDVAAR